MEQQTALNTPALIWRGRGAQIRHHLCEAAGIASLKILYEGKRKPIMRARQAGMYLCRLYTNLSYAQIAKLFGRSDHTTSRHAFEHIPLYAECEPVTRRLLSDVRKRLEKDGMTQMTQMTPIAQENNGTHNNELRVPADIKSSGLIGTHNSQLRHSHLRRPKPRKPVGPHAHPLVKEFFTLCQGMALCDIDEQAGFSGNTVCNWKTRNTPYLPNFEAALNVLGYELCIRRKEVAPVKAAPEKDERAA